MQKMGKPRPREVRLTPKFGQNRNSAKTEIRPTEVRPWNSAAGVRYRPYFCIGRIFIFGQTPASKIRRQKSTAELQFWPNFRKKKTELQQKRDLWFGPNRKSRPSAKRPSIGFVRSSANSLAKAEHLPWPNSSGGALVAELGRPNTILARTTHLAEFYFCPTSPYPKRNVKPKMVFSYFFPYLHQNFISHFSLSRKTFSNVFMKFHVEIVFLRNS